MKSLLLGIAALPFLATFATADPLKLDSNQMDRVTAGWQVTEVDWYNGGMSAIAVYPRAPNQDIGSCGSAAAGCVLNIHSPTISFWSWIPVTEGQNWPVLPVAGGG
jgi:hypothetical protein